MYLAAMAAPGKRRTTRTIDASRKRSSARRSSDVLILDEDERIAEVITLVEKAQGRVYQVVNAELITLYWQLGEHISRKITGTKNSDNLVEKLTVALGRRFAGRRGFALQNLNRMRQFYEAYSGRKSVSALLTQLPWTHHLLILGQAKTHEQQEFYVLTAIKERWSSHELERQIQSGAALRNMQAHKKRSGPRARMHPTTAARSRP